jgi:MHS family proline/betaine transporter-like MFS transporter
MSDTAKKQHFPIQKTILAGLIGNAIEFYDFIIYAYLAAYFAIHFFPSNDPTAAIILSYGAFATGMVMRPIGGLLLGSIGDKLGRRLALQLTVTLIAVPTLVIGLLPTYETIGLWAPILLILLRMLQGLAVGGEYSASIVFMIERSAPNHRGFIGSFSPMGAFLGLLLGTAVCFICLLILGKEAMIEWGWRVPFLLSLVLSFYGVWLRKTITHEPSNNSYLRHQSPIRQVFRRHFNKVLAIAFANTATGIVSFIGFMYIVPWAVKEAGISSNLALGINLLNLLMVALFCVWGGHLGDRFGCVRVARLGALILLLGAWPAFALVKTGGDIPLILGGIILAIGQGFFVGPLCAAMACLLPANVRITGIGLGYSFSVGVFGGCAPMVTEFLIDRYALVMAPALVIAGGALVSFVALNSAIWKGVGELLPEEMAVSEGQHKIALNKNDS